MKQFYFCGKIPARFLFFALQDDWKVESRRLVN